VVAVEAGGQAASVGHNEDRSRARRCEAALVAQDVVNRLGCGGAGVELDVASEDAIDERFDPEIEISVRAGGRRAEIVVRCADLRDGGVLALNPDDRSRTGHRAYGSVVRFVTLSQHARRRVLLHYGPPIILFIITYSATPE